MAKPLSVLFVSSEVVPFAKTGGLADVSAALPQVVRELGHDIRIIMPKFAAVSDRKFKIHDIKRLTDMPIQLGDRTLLGSVKSSFLTNIKTKVQVYFLSNDELYCRSDLYVDPKTKKAWPDNDDRFIFFCRGVIQTLILLGWKPDIIHLNDWQSGLIAALLKTEYADEPLFKNTKIVFTVHNAAYQGLFPEASFVKTGLPEKAFKVDGVEFHGGINLMKAHRSGKRHVLLLYRRAMDRMWQGTLPFGLIMGIFWWQITTSAIPIIELNQPAWLLVGAMVALLIAIACIGTYFLPEAAPSKSEDN